jgi:predicted dehydrogenase
LESKWRGTWAKDGGALMNQCIHNIDLLIWLMNSDVSEVFAYTDNLNHNYIETEDFGIAVLKFNNGKYGLIEGTTSVFKQNLEETLYLFGQKGTIKIGGKSVNIIDEWQVENCTNASDIKQEHSELPSNIYGFGHIHIYKDMISSIKNSRAPYVTGLDGKKAMEVVIAIYKSAVENKPIKLPLKEGKTLDFVGRFK